MKQVSISDDDLCSTCQFCRYRPGETSTCSLNATEAASKDEDGYVVACAKYVATRPVEVKPMEINMTSIGTLEEGIDGRDEYLLLARKDDDMTPEQAIKWLLPKVYRRSTMPGDYYCTSVKAVQAQHSTCKVICTIEHRYDI